MLRGHRSPAVAVLLAAVALSACGTHPAEFNNEAASDEGPSRVEEVKGSDLARVHLSARAAQRLGIETATVRAAPDAPLAVPYAALLYDALGQAYTYTSPSRLTYVRQPVTVRSIVHRMALLSDGPPLGTPVVTVGVAELLGVETGVEED